MVQSVKQTLVVLISCKTPQFPKTSSLAAWGSATHEKVMSLSAMTSLGVRASLAPASTKSRTFIIIIISLISQWKNLMKHNSIHWYSDLICGSVPHTDLVARVQQILHHPRSRKVYSSYEMFFREILSYASIGRFKNILHNVKHRLLRVIKDFHCLSTKRALSGFWYFTFSQ